MAATSIILPVRADKPHVETASDTLPVYIPGKYLTFRVARQDFAMNASHVRGILPLHEMVALEIPHPSISGFAAVNGRDFPVVDLRAKLKVAHAAQGREPFIIAVDAGEKLIGFIADRVSEIIDVRQRDFRNGAIRTQGRPRRILDPHQIMKDEDWSTFWLNSSL